MDTTPHAAQAGGMQYERHSTYGDRHVVIEMCPLSGEQVVGDLERCEAALAEARRERDKLRSESHIIPSCTSEMINGFRAERDAALALVAGHIEEKDRLRSEVHRLTNDSGAHSHFIEDARGDVVEMQQRVRDANVRMEHIDRDRDSLRTAVAALTRENDSLKLALAQRGEAEAMRERCAKVCEEVRDRNNRQAELLPAGLRAIELFKSARAGAHECVLAIRAISPSAREGQ